MSCSWATQILKVKRRLFLLPGSISIVWQSKFGGKPTDQSADYQFRQLSITNNMTKIERAEIQKKS